MKDRCEACGEHIPPESVLCVPCEALRQDNIYCLCWTDDCLNLTTPRSKTGPTTFLAERGHRICFPCYMKNVTAKLDGILHSLFSGIYVHRSNPPSALG